MYRLYDHKCHDCGYVFERIVEDDEFPDCPLCKGECHRMPPVIRINMGVGPYGYYDENLNAFVGTNRERRELCRQKGVTPKGETPKPTGEQWV